MSSLYHPELCRTNIAADDAEHVITILAGALLEQRLVHPSFTEAVIQRERTSPTGLPMTGRKVAVPHTDPEHVITSAVAVGTLARPVCFREMGNPDSRLEVDVVLLLALRDRDSIQAELVRLIESFQRPGFVDQLYDARGSRALFQLVGDGEQP